VWAQEWGLGQAQAQGQEWALELGPLKVQVQDPEWDLVRGLDPDLEPGVSPQAGPGVKSNVGPGVGPGVGFGSHDCCGISTTTIVVSFIVNHSTSKQANNAKKRTPNDCTHS
jgi:hypothetical protein